ncbi:hypothetical protein QP568_06035 [Propionimicrobium lymphophilum]|uniref:hypothetical protein n=1 Tax=Propionimicrobium lymphophilum TaxID=33012 RepID=UPI00254A5955|nr:hypothetical protein [Propionimicrobium lymphophilum]MDK7710567.1 hypothetical protein [Propionimicrobium lymphophilum]MDK7733847.1 hypothetical protein [Propionimicrobium lymphophilum]
MHRNFIISTRNLFVVLGLAAIPTTIFLRYLWSLSLGNGDELFFSTGAGRFEVSEGSPSQWADFFSWLWWKHTGRTADWLSGSVYFFGAKDGRWIISILTVLSATTITWCLHRLSTIYYHSKSASIYWVAPVSLLTLLFSYSCTSLYPLANLTMYSAAVCNYLVPSALICSVLTFGLIAQRTAALYGAAVIGSIAATMHEQAAATLAVLAVLFVIIGSSKWPILHRFGCATIIFSGVIEMFLAPGLHSKLARFSTSSPEIPISMPNKLITTFYAFGVYFPFLGAVISTIIALYLICFIRLSQKRFWSIALLGLLSVSFATWVLSLLFFALKHSTGSQTIIGLSCMAMMAVWLVTPLLSHSKPIRFGTLIFLCAASSLAIPAAAGLGAIRVFNYPVIFFLIFQIWTAYIIVGNPSELFGHGGTATRHFSKKWLLPVVYLLMSAWVMGWSLIALQENYVPGVTNLEIQDASCLQENCPAADPNLPHPSAMSGYGEHDYANTDAVLEWLEK